MLQENVQAAIEKLSALEKHTRQVPLPLVAVTVVAKDISSRLRTLRQPQDYWSPLLRYQESQETGVC